MKYYDDFQLGEKIVTKGRTITEADIVLFAAFSGDWHQLHTNAEFAKKGPFGERIAHGFLILCVASGLMPLEDIAVVAFYGMNQVRFLGPTRIGDTVHIEMDVTEMKEKGTKNGVVAFKSSIMNQKEEAVAVMDMQLMLSRKGSVS